MCVPSVQTINYDSLTRKFWTLFSCSTLQRYLPPVTAKENSAVAGLILGVFSEDFFLRKLERTRFFIIYTGQILACLSKAPKCRAIGREFRYEVLPWRVKWQGGKNVKNLYSTGEFKAKKRLKLEVEKERWNQYSNFQYRIDKNKYFCLTKIPMCIVCFCVYVWKHKEKSSGYNSLKNNSI